MDRLLAHSAVVDARGRLRLEHSLLRVSALREGGCDQGIAHGMSIAVQQSVCSCAHALLDLLLSPGRPSLLVLGAAGSGKTCLLRYAARLLADAGARMLCMDSSGDLGGDGIVVHAALSSSRRLLVLRRGKQAVAIAGALASHAPEVLVVDELDGAADVAALRRARLRCVRVLAGKCGDLAGLLGSPSSRGELLGPVASDGSALFGAPPRLFEAAVQAVGSAGCSDRSLLVLADAAAAADAAALAFGSGAAAEGAAGPMRAHSLPVLAARRAIVEVERRLWVADAGTLRHRLCVGRSSVLLLEHI